ncbi:MAG: LysM peptidoglycan-binding domain-containing protein [Rhodospirillales bacterium]|nr:LysM peptidoglycan-binding domain-containing protein [Alphaproteobacteria bacterium]USO04884.1 MAG: LysM peptidoglycan-binding domain-containing protein [Rhodospirillales bacterium]
MAEGKPEHQIHEIVWGDTLSELADRFGTTVDELVELNEIKNPDYIRAGDTLKLPEVEPEPEQTAAPEASASSEEQFVEPPVVETVEISAAAKPPVEQSASAAALTNGFNGESGAKAEMGTSSERQTSSSPASAGDAFSNAAEGEKNWAIRYGAEPFDAHVFTKINRLVGSETLDKLNDVGNDIFHGGFAAFGNHLYMEFGTLNDDGEFEVQRRIHSFTIADDGEGNKIIATENDGTLFTLASGGIIPFHEDPIYVMDHHKTKAGQLQSADDDFLFGEGATKIVAQNLTKREAMGIYNVALKGGTDYNDRNIPVDGANVNGNTMHAGLRSLVEAAAQTLGPEKMLDFNFDPSGWDAGLSYYNDLVEEGQKPSENMQIPQHTLSEYSTLQELEQEIVANEQKLAAQWQPSRDLAVNVNLTGKPDEKPELIPQHIKDFDPGPMA